MAENDSYIKRDVLISPKLQRNSFVISAIILTAFALFFVTWYFNLGVRPFAKLISNYKSIHYIVNYLIVGLIPATALLLLHKPNTILYTLGLTHGFGRGLLFGVRSTAPMLIGYAVTGSFNEETSPDHMFTFIVVAGFFEELIFRGFVFGELFRTAHWGFLPAAMLTALAFGSLHLYQGHDPASSLAAFAITAAGSIFFSWIYVESGNNLWSAIWLHTLMNAPWILFDVSESGAVGGLWANGLRLCTLLIAIALVVIYKKRKGLPYYISWKTLIINR